VALVGIGVAAIVLGAVPQARADLKEIFQDLSSLGQQLIPKICKAQFCQKAGNFLGMVNSLLGGNTSPEDVVMTAAGINKQYTDDSFANAEGELPETNGNIGSLGLPVVGDIQASLFTNANNEYSLATSQILASNLQITTGGILPLGYFSGTNQALEGVLLSASGKLAGASGQLAADAQKRKSTLEVMKNVSRQMVFDAQLSSMMNKHLHDIKGLNASSGLQLKQIATDISAMRNKEAVESITDANAAANNEGGESATVVSDVRETTQPLPAPPKKAPPQSSKVPGMTSGGPFN
jgi:hypothetical protein